MIPELRELRYEDRLKEMGLPTLQDRRKRGDLITLYKIVNGIEKLDNQNLVVMEEETRQIKEDQKELVSERHEKIQFFHIELWTPGMY